MRTALLFLVVFLLFCGAGPAAAQTQARNLTVDLAEDHVDITAGFNGARLTLFGVRESAGDVAIVIRGPERKMVVRRKESVAGIWVNRRSMRFRRVPSYYDFAVNKQEERLAPRDVLKENGIGLNALYLDPDTEREDPEHIANFQEALIRNNQAKGLYPLNPKEIVFLSDRLFRTTFYLPPNVPVGHYQVLTFLIKDGEITEKRSMDLRVAQVGLGARIYEFAHAHSLAYGLVCVFIAMMAGWTVNLLRRKN